jgi:hypothetical protein
MAFCSAVSISSVDWILGYRIISISAPYPAVAGPCHPRHMRD